MLQGFFLPNPSTGAEEAVAAAEAAAADAEAAAAAAAASSVAFHNAADVVGPNGYLSFATLNTAYASDQIDYVNLIRANVARYTTMRIARPAPNAYQVRMSEPTTGKGCLYQFVKDAHDDFLKLDIGCASYGLATKAAHVAVAGDLTTTGAAWNTATSSWYATAVGSTCTLTVAGGSTLVLFIVTEVRGGLWSVMVDGAPVANISCWAASGVTIVPVTVATGLSPNVSHTVLLTFLGVDPANAPVPPPARGYIRNDVTGALIGYIPDASTDTPVIAASSNKEFAFSTSFTDPESGTAWIPEHNGVGTAFQVDAPVFYNDTTVIDPTAYALGVPTDITRFSLVQHFKGRILGVDVAEFWTTHTITSDGLITFSGRMTALVAIAPGITGYPMMLPGGPTFTTFITGLQNTEVSPGDSSFYYFTAERDNVFSGAVISSGNQNLIAGCTLLNPRMSYRRGRANKPTPGQDMFVWNRPTPPKLYWESMVATPYAIGDSYAWSFQMMAGNIVNAYALAQG